MDNEPKTPDRKQDASVPRQESALAHTPPEIRPVAKKVREHVFFGMHKNKTLSPQDELNTLRDLRTDDF